MTTIPAKPQSPSRTSSTPAVAPSQALSTQKSTTETRPARALSDENPLERTHADARTQQAARQSAVQRDIDARARVQVPEAAATPGVSVEQAAPPDASPSGVARQIARDEFQGLLGRTPAYGDWWQEQAAQQAGEGRSPDEIRAWVRNGIMGSQEYTEKNAARVAAEEFQNVLGRPAGEDGYWSQQAQQLAKNGSSLDDIRGFVREGVMGSQEYAIHKAGDVAKEEFQNLLGRAPEAGDWWQQQATEQAREGRSLDEIRGWVRNGISGTPEYALKNSESAIRDAHVSLLGREPDANTLSSTKDRIAERINAGELHNLDEVKSSVENELKASDEYKAKHRPAFQGDLVPNQMSLGYPDGPSACGPAALGALMRANGQDANLRQLTNEARQFGWTVDGGMNGFGNFARMVNSKGMTFRQGGVGDVRSVVESGKPVVISSAAHYYVAQKYDPASGKYYLGSSGTVMSRYGGKEWMTLDEMDAASKRCAGGGINGVGWAA